MRQLGNLLVAVQRSLRPLGIGKDFKEMPEMLCALAAEYLKDIPDRNPVEEEIKEMKEEMEEQSETDKEAEPTDTAV